MTGFWIFAMRGLRREVEWNLTSLTLRKHLRMYGWEINFLFGEALFRGYVGILGNLCQKSMNEVS